jgi:hypothetical protein
MIIIPINMLMMIISIHNISHLMILMAHGLRKKNSDRHARLRGAATPGRCAWLSPSFGLRQDG